MKTQKGFLSMLWAPVLILAVAFAISQSILAIKNEYYKDWEGSPGVVVDYKYFASGGRDVRVYYSYDVNGKSYNTYEFWDYQRDGEHPEIGSEAIIWYNPKNPSEASRFKPSPAFESLAPYFLAAPLIIGSIQRNRRKRSEFNSCNRQGGFPSRVTDE